MTTDRSRRWRPEGGRRSSKLRLAGYRRYFPEPRLPRTGDDHSPNIDGLVEEAMTAALSGEARVDETFGAYSTLFGFCRSAVMQEGRLLEIAIEHAIRENPELSLLPARPMPIVPAAQEMLKRTPAANIKGVRFPSRVHATETYKPDLLIINRTKHSGLILDVKRSLASHRPQDIDRLRFKMLAVASIAPEWVAEHRGPLLVEIETAIVDGADEMSDHERGVFRLSEIDHLLGTSGAAESIRGVREQFSRRVQDELTRRCRALATPSAAASATGSSEEPGGRSARQIDSTDTPLESFVADAKQPRRFGYARRPSLH